MKNAGERLTAAIQSSAFIALTLSAPRAQEEEAPRRVEAKPVLLRGARRVQFAFYQGRRVTHRNLTPPEAAALAARLLAESFRQGHLRTETEEITLAVNRQGRLTARARPVERAPADLSHDRRKEHLLPEGQPCAFLERLGVMTADGRVIAARRDKFRQVNRFLEMVADVTDALPADRPVRVVDFGCGKSYLTFALHHYLRDMRGLKVEITGVDVKREVIAHCESVARDLDCEGLRFAVGDIRRFEAVDRADMVTALHACDTATDDALARAVRWNASVILAAPCCQHELLRQIAAPTMRLLLKHGILRERMASLLTDGLRAALLEIAGYAVQVMEFVETEHTPKNLLLRAVRHDHPPAERERLTQEYRALRDFWSVRPALEGLLAESPGALA